LLFLIHRLIDWDELITSLRHQGFGMQCGTYIRCKVAFWFRYFSGWIFVCTVSVDPCWEFG
jgi:hypothetical protein